MPTTANMTKPFKRQLPCELTDQEMKERGHKAGELKAKIDATRRKMNDAVAGHKQDLKDLNGKLNVLLSDLERGAEDRMVECIEVKDFTKKKAEVVRTDTNTTVETRTLDPFEMQTEIKAEAKGKKEDPLATLEVIWKPGDDPSHDMPVEAKAPKGKRGRSAKSANV
jgi:hypothetical protein